MEIFLKQLGKKECNIYELEKVDKEYLHKAVEIDESRKVLPGMVAFLIILIGLINIILTELENIISFLLIIGVLMAGILIIIKEMWINYFWYKKNIKDKKIFEKNISKIKKTKKYKNSYYIGVSKSSWVSSRTFFVYKN